MEMLCRRRSRLITAERGLRAHRIARYRDHMSEEWVSAYEALKLVMDSTSFSQAPRAICARAYAGLVETRARRVILHDRVLDDAPVPANFWWAEGKAALIQNWGNGDFDTWIDERLHYRAF